MRSLGKLTTVAAIPLGLAGAAMAGSGALVVATTVKALTRVALVGSGAMLTRTNFNKSASKRFAGTGQLLVNGQRSQSPFASANFAGAGQLLAVGSYIQAASAGFAGTGQLLADGQIGSSIQNASANFSGNGQFLVSSGAYSYHRIHFTESISGDPGISIAEVLMRQSTGGANISGGTWTADSEYSGSNTAAHARDGNASTFWATLLFDVPWWIQVYWGAGITKFLAEVVLSVRNDGYRNVDPKTFKFQGSHDGIVWDDLWVPATQTTWSNGESRTFTKP